MRNIFEIDTDIKLKMLINEPTVVQNDAIRFIIRVFDNGQPLDLTNVETVSLANVRLDRKTVVTPGTKIGTNTVQFDLGTEETKFPGRVEATAQFYDSEGRVSTISFSYRVVKDPTGEGYIPTERDQTLIEIVLGDGPLVIQQAQDAAEYATAQGDYAKAQGDYAKSVADANKTRWLNPVATFADIATTYPNPQHGDTVMVTDDVENSGSVYRYENGQWNLTQKHNDLAIADVQKHLEDLTTMKEVEESAPLGNELITDGSAWVLGAGWTGDFTTGFTHEVGNTEPLIYPLNAVAGSLYEVVLTIESTDEKHGYKFNVTVGDSYPFEMYRGDGNTIVYRNGIQAATNGDLKIIPKADFTGTVKNISVKEIVGTIPPTTVIKDQNESSVYEARPTKVDNENIFIGKQSGQYNTSGRMNTIIGNEAMANNTSGYFNSALGYKALQKNTVGSRNLALAYAALQNNISGHRNVALGTFALNRNTHGHNNIAIGADTLWYNTTGSHNIAMGLTALEFNETGVGNIAIGYRSLSENKSNHFMVAIGYDAGKSLKSDSSVAIGSWAMKSTTTGKENTAVGGYSLQSNVTGQYNVAVGAFAGSSSTGNENTFIGRSAGSVLETGHQNVFVGRSAGSGLKTGTKNIFIGCEATARAETLHNHLNIGNTIYADMANDMVGIGIDDPKAILDLKAGSAARPPIRLKAGELTTYAFGGAIEYDGSALYITLADGVRRKFVLEEV